MSQLAGSGWDFDEVDGKHALWRCRSCRRRAVTLKGAAPSVLGKCTFCSPARP